MAKETSVLDKAKAFKGKDVVSTLEARVEMLEKHVRIVEKKKPKGWGLDRYKCNSTIEEYRTLLKIAKKS